MKLKTILLITALSITLVFIACKNIPLGGTICDSCIPAKPKWAPNITYEEAHEMSLHYSRDTGKQYVYKDFHVTQQKDALNINFDLVELKNFIEAIEKYACDYKCTDRLGVRIYYGRYPTKKVMSDREWKLGNANRHTVFMVPTYWNPVMEKSIDFDCTQGCRAKFEPGKYAFILSALGQYDQDAKNHGGMMPPPEGGVFPTY
jgi:hypothetical protein